MEQKVNYYLKPSEFEDDLRNFIKKWYEPSENYHLCDTIFTVIWNISISNGLIKEVKEPFWPKI